MFGNKLNATIAKVTGFIAELEKGVASNEALISKCKDEVVGITADEVKQIEKIKSKAAAKRTIALETNTALSTQNEVARKLLAKLQ